MTENSSRAFMYGESVFTTTRLINGVLQDWDLHFERLRKGVEFLYGPFVDSDDWVAHFKNQVEAKTQDVSGDKILRITVFLEQSSRVMRCNLIPVTDLKIQVSHSELDQTRLGNQVLKLRTCPVVKRPHWWPPYLKVGNYLSTILSQRIYLKPEDDDVLFLSEDDTVLESSVANIFVVKHNKVYTAPIGANVLDGVMRKRVLQTAPGIFDDVIESETTVEQLYKAEGVFGSNSVRGIFLVDRIDDYTITYSKDFIDRFNILKAKLVNEKT